MNKNIYFIAGYCHLSSGHMTDNANRNSKAWFTGSIMFANIDTVPTLATNVNWERNGSKQQTGRWEAEGAREGVKMCKNAWGHVSAVAAAKPWVDMKKTLLFLCWPESTDLCSSAKSSQSFSSVLTTFISAHCDASIMRDRPLLWLSSFFFSLFFFSFFFLLSSCL